MMRLQDTIMNLNHHAPFNYINPAANKYYKYYCHHH